MFHLDDVYITFIRFVFIFSIKKEITYEFTKGGREDGCCDYKSEFAYIEDECSVIVSNDLTHLLLILKN